MFEILECCPIPQFALGLDHKVTFWNKACEKLTGFSASAMVGTRNHWQPFYSEKRPMLADILLQNDFEQFLSLYQTSSPGRSTLVPFAWEATSFFKNIEGESRYLYFLAAPIVDAKGSRLGVVETLQDISKQKRHELEIENKSAKLEKENKKLRSSISDRYKFAGIIGKSKVMQEVYRLILKAAATDDNVILYGESGTGKELVAKGIHDHSRRRDKAFVVVNCGAVPETLLESEFFGYKKGAFTSACHDQKGYFDVADGGTLFLDEVAELSFNMQVKLLRALESGEFTPLGCNRAQTADVRIIAATNNDLTKQIAAGKMREDFFYRIHVIPIYLPPLQDRKEDLPLLIDHFLMRYDPEIILPKIPGKIIEMLHEYPWPGNIRELKNVLKRYVALGRLDFVQNRQLESSTREEIQDLQTALDEHEKKIIVRVLQEQQWHRQHVAGSLGISRKTLFRKMKKLGIL